MSGKKYTAEEVREEFEAGFEFAEDVGHTTSAKVKAEALRRHPDKEDKR
jgi:hypothetical protein